MDYEKKYKDAQKWIESIYTELSHEHQMEAESFFPELKESEDERIRKRIIHALHGDVLDMEETTKAISWLEKQKTKKNEWLFEKGKWYVKLQHHYEGDLRHFEKGHVYQALSEVEITDGYHNVSLGSWEIPEYFRPATKDEIPEEAKQTSRLDEDEEIRNYFINAVKEQPNIHQEWKEKCLNWLEKQGEQKPIIEMKSPEESLGISSKEYNEIVNECLYGESKTDEPKFKVGNWYQCIKDFYFFGKGVTFDKNTAYYCAKEGCLQNEYGCHIAIVKDLYDNFKLWTIKDAKPGDILFHSDSASNGIFIFKELLKYEFSEKVICYCDYDSEDYFCLGEHHTCCWTDAKILHPATKEQRDLLFQKMKEDGYEWDAEKKELKEIEDEEYNGEDYGIDSLFHAQRILEKTLGSVDGYQTDDGILSHQCAITAVKKLYEQKPAEWSEEDEDYYDAIITKLEVTQDDAALTDNQMEFLKSLKGRVRPKQEWSEEDEKMIGRIRGIVEAYAFSQSAVDVNGDLCEKKFIDADIWLKTLRQRIGG